MAKNQRLAWYRWEWPDSRNSQLWTACTISIYRPTYERPYVSVLLSIANGGGRVLFRCASLDDLRRRIVVPEEATERLEKAVTQGQQHLQEIMADLRYISERRSMPPGTCVVRADTNEIIAEAERIFEEGR